MRKAWRPGALTAVLTAAVTATTLVAADPAAAVTRERAAKIAIQATKAESRPGNVAVFALLRPLRGRATVIEAGFATGKRSFRKRVANRTLKPRRRGKRVPRRQRGVRSGVTRIRRAPALGRPAWLIWVDLSYQAMFQHPSVLVLVDRRTGRVRAKRRMTWFPLINGRRPPFLRSRRAYQGNRFKLYSSVAGTATSASATSRAAWPIAQASETAIPPGTFSRDCMITIGRFGEPQLASSFSDLERLAAQMGIPVYQASAGRPARGGGNRGQAPDGNVLAANVDWLIKNTPCRDVFIYIAGHGSPAGRIPNLPEPLSKHLFKPTKHPTVLVGHRFKLVDSDSGREQFARDEKGQRIKETAAEVTDAHLRKLMRDHPKVTFKLKIDSCFSGRFISRLASVPNLLIAETSSSGSQLSWLNLRSVKRPDGAVVNNGLGNNPGRSEFTNGNIRGLRDLAFNSEVIDDLKQEAQDRGVSFLAIALAYAFHQGASSDFARQNNLTTPGLHTRFPPP